jgi:hypothetical protein
MVTKSFVTGNCVQPVGSSACAQGASIFFLLDWGEQERFFSFFLIPNVSPQILNGFSSRSQWVLHVFVMFLNIFPIAPLFIPYDLTNVVLLSPIEWPKSRRTLLVWEVMHPYSLSNNKVFVSHHCHFRLDYPNF